jgi:hypothetical protein
VLAVPLSQSSERTISYADMKRVDLFPEDKMVWPPWLSENADGAQRAADALDEAIQSAESDDECPAVAVLYVLAAVAPLTHSLTHSGTLTWCRVRAWPAGG